VRNQEIRERTRVTDVISRVAELSGAGYVASVKNRLSGLYFSDPEEQREKKVGHNGSG